MLTFGYMQSVHAANSDSLWTVWKNESLHDTIRLKAIGEYARDGYLYSQPDSAFFFAQIMYDYAHKKVLRKWMAKALNLQGNSFIVRGDYFKAFNFYNRSILLSEAAGDQLEIATSLHSIGIIYYYQGDHVKAIDYYMKSLKIRESINDKQGISKSLNNIGIVYSEQEQFHFAKEYFTRSLVLCRELGDRRGEASALNNIGLVDKALGDFDSAYQNYMLSMQISESNGDKRDIASTLNNIGHIYELKGDFEKALECFHQSIIIKEEIGDRQGTSVSLNNIGRVYEQLQKPNEAVKWCLKSLKKAQEVGSLIEQKKACDCLYNNYKSLGAEEKALNYHELMFALNDSINDAETQKVLQQMDFSRKVTADSIAKADEKQKIQLAHREEVKKKNQTRNIFIAASILLLFGAIALYNRVRYIRKSRTAISIEKERSDNLLLNILPEDIARELKEKGEATARKFENVSILFTDFKDFTQQSAKLTPEELVAELNSCFVVFDSICEKYKIEKIKTIGDAYMVAGGLPVPCSDSAKKTVLAAIEMSDFMVNRKKSRAELGLFSFEMRAGIHTGKVVAGIVGVKKFQYDIWGDTVNLASRMESASEPGKVNISRATYEQIKDDPDFRFQVRGELQVKGKGCTEMFYVDLSDRT